MTNTDNLEGRIAHDCAPDCEEDIGPGILECPVEACVYFASWTILWDGRFEDLEIGDPISDGPTATERNYQSLFLFVKCYDSCGIRYAPRKL